MFLDNPIASKIVILTITRAVLLTGAVLLRPQCHIVASTLMLIGASSLVLTGLLGVGIATGAPALALFSSAVHISSTLEVGGWIAFTTGFVVFAIQNRKIAEQRRA